MEGLSLLRRTKGGVVVVGLSMALCATSALAQCPPPEPPLQNYTGTAQATCPCFAVGEQAGVVLDLPPGGEYPIEVLRIGIAWGSYLGGQPQTIEHAVRIYPAGPPSPGTALFELLGPVMTDGFINEFDLSATPVEVDGGPFMVALEFENANASNVFAPSVVDDNNGCQPGKNSIYAIPGGWRDACATGVSGDWVMYVVYRSACATGTEELVASNAPVLLGSSPNPFGTSTNIAFHLPQDSPVDIAVYDVRGRRVAELEKGTLPAGRHGVVWDGRGDDGTRLPSGTYFVRMNAGGVQTTRKVALLQ